MAATYDPNLPTDMDWVRFLIGDRDTATATFQDEEIRALISDVVGLHGTGRWVKYLAAALAGGVVLAQGGDVVMKSVGDLKIEYGADEPESGYRVYLRSLQEKGAAYLLRVSGSHVLRNL